MANASGTRRDRRNQMLSRLSDAALHFLEFPFARVDHQLIADSLRSLTGAVMTSVATYNDATHQLTVEGVSADPRAIKSLTELIGSNLRGQSFAVDDAVLKGHLSRELVRIDGLYDLSFGAFPRPLCDQAELLLNAGEVWGRGLVHQGRVLGNIAIVMPAGKALPEPDIIELYARQVSATMRRQELEISLQSSEERFRTLFHQAQDVVLLHEVSSDGTPGKFVEVNETACTKLGYSRDQLLQLTPFEITAWANPEKVRRSLQRFKEQGSIKDEMTVVAMDGRWIPFEINSHVIQLGGKRLALAVCRDISRRKQMEEALRQSEERYRLLVDMSPDAIAIESEGQMVFANKAAAEMAGVDNPEELLGRSFLDFIHPADRDRAQARIQALLKGADLPPLSTPS